MFKKYNQQIVQQLIISFGLICSCRGMKTWGSLICYCTKTVQYNSYRCLPVGLSRNLVLTLHVIKRFYVFLPLKVLFQSTWLRLKQDGGLSGGTRPKHWEIITLSLSRSPLLSKVTMTRNWRNDSSDKLSCTCKKCSHFQAMTKCDNNSSFFILQ